MLYGGKKKRTTKPVVDWTPFFNQHRKTPRGNKRWVFQLGDQEGTQFPCGPMPFRRAVRAAMQEALFLHVDIIIVLP